MDRWVLRFWWALLFGVMCWYSVAEGITKTRVQDTLYNANGTLASGTITVRWDGFTAADGSSIVGSSMTLRIVNGVLIADLVPNGGGSRYTASYLMDGRRSYEETWVVPQSATPVRLAQIRLVGTAGGGAGSSGGGNIYTSGTSTGVGPTPFTPTVTWEVYDATGGSGVTRQILRAGAGQGTAPLLSFHAGSGSEAVGFRVPPLSASTTYTLPAQDGLPGSFLRTDGVGNLTWAAGQSAVTGEFYQTFQNAGTSLAQRHNADFRNGLQAVDNAGADRTEVSPVYGATANTVTQGNDPRLSDARAPTAHAATHASGGSDPVTPQSIGALKNTSDTLNTGAASNIGLVVKGAAGQAASLQEWQDSSGNVLASVTGTGRVSFQEAFFSPRAGETATSLFFQIDGLNRFAMTTFANALNFHRYDDAGNFKDVALQLVRAGDTSINTSLVVNDPTPTTGATKVTVKAGAGQGAANLQEWQSSGGSILSRVDSNGFFQFPAGQKQGTGAKVQHFSGIAPLAEDCAKFDANGNIVSAGGSCASGQSPAFYDGVAPAGTIDGVNAVFTLSPAPNPPESLTLARNGLVQKAGSDFNLSSGTITFTSGAIPQAGDTLLAFYRAGLSSPASLFDTSDQGYFFGVAVQPPETSGATTTFTSNVHRVWQFVLPFGATVNQLSFEVVATSGASTSLGLGLWNASCTSLVLNSGVMTAGGSPDINTAGIKTKTISGGAVKLAPGVYWLAMTTNSTTLTLRSMALPSQAISLINAQSNKKFAQAANNGSAGGFPASCGGVTTAVNNQPPMVLFER